MRVKWYCSGAVVALLLAGCGPNGPTGSNGGAEPADTATPARPANGPPARAAVDEERLRNAANEPAQWMTHGGTYDEQRFSRLDQISTDNVGELGLAWYADFDTNQTQQATPLVADGVIYVSTAWSKVNAYDAVTGELLWHYDPEVPGEQGAMGCCGPVSRGLAMWNGKVYVATFDGRLIAVDAATGEEVWSTMTVDHDYYSITGAPRAVKGLVVIGNGGAELGVRGYVTAYDAETGEKAWRFYLVPGNPADGSDGEVSDQPLAEIALPTWDGEFWAMGGGGTAWDALVYDPELDLLYIGTGNGSPWNASTRSPGGGDNLFLVSIVAVRPDTGEYVWHYQQNPWESWDYTATMPIMIADLDFGGQTRRVLMQAPKNGFFYVLDAATGEFISAENYVPVNWAERIDPETGRPVEIPEARYDVTGEPYILQPGFQGAHTWHPWSFHPDTGLVYFAGRQSSAAFAAAQGEQTGLFRTGVDWISGDHLYDEPGNDIPRGVHGRLLAWDPVNQREVWSRDLGGIGAGTLTTAGGLVFQPAQQRVHAYRADDGERLWSSQPLHTYAVAGPVSYEVDGVQYIAQVVGAGADVVDDRGPGAYYSSNHSRLLAYRLGGTAELPPPTPPVELVLDPPPDDADEAIVTRGEQAYGQACAICHDTGSLARGMFPDLRYSPALWDQRLFDTIVLEGQRQGQGMPAFGDSVTTDDSEAMRAYLVHLANRLAAQQQE